MIIVLAVDDCWEERDAGGIIIREVYLFESGSR
jgi:hypothetical protein